MSPEERDRRIAQVNTEYAPWIESTARNAQEFGVLAIRNALIVSGGALLAVPTLSSLAEDFCAPAGVWAATAFAASVLFTLIASYAAYLNWSVLAKIYQDYRNVYMDLRLEVPEDKRRSYPSKSRSVWLSFYVIQGCAGFILVLLCFGGFQLYRALTLGALCSDGVGLIVF